MNHIIAASIAGGIGIIILGIILGIYLKLRCFIYQKNRIHRDSFRVDVSQSRVVFRVPTLDSIQLEDLSQRSAAADDTVKAPMQIKLGSIQDGLSRRLAEHGALSSEVYFCLLPF
jgi:hypothetical protein